jgi:hypothetical protein
MVKEVITTVGSMLMVVCMFSSRDYWKRKMWTPFCRYFLTYLFIYIYIQDFSTNMGKESSSKPIIGNGSSHNMQDFFPVAQFSQ